MAGRHGLVNGRFDFLQKATLQFLTGLLEIVLGQRAFGLFSFQFGQLVAEDGEVGCLAVSLGLGGAQAHPERRQNEGGSHRDEQGGKEGKLGHFGSSSLSSASARRASSAESGWSLAARRSARR